MRQRTRSILQIYLCTFALAHASLSAQAPPTEAEIEQAFQQLEQAFLVKATASLGPESFGDPAVASAWLSKALVARTAAASFNRANVKIRADIGRQSLPDPPLQVVRTDRMDCTPKRGCRSNCDDDCKRDTFLGEVIDPFCFAGCTAEKAACEALKSSEKAGCEVAKGLFAEKKVGEISFTNLSAEAVGEVRDLTLSVTEDLSGAQLSAAFSASATLRGSIHFRPELLVGVGVACIEFTGEARGTQVSAPDQSLTITAALDLKQTEQGISLDVSFEEIEPEVVLVGNPFIDAALSDLTNFVKCPLITAVGILADAFTGDLPIHRKIKIPGGAPLPVGAVAVLDGLSLTPRLTGTAVGLVEKTADSAIADGGAVPTKRLEPGGVR